MFKKSEPSWVRSWLLAMAVLTLTTGVTCLAAAILGEPRFADLRIFAGVLNVAIGTWFTWGWRALR